MTNPSLDCNVLSKLEKAESLTRQRVRWKKNTKKVSRKCNIFKIHLRTSQSWYLQDVKWCKGILYSSLCYWHRHKANKSQKEHIAHQSLWSARFLKTTSSYPVSALSQIRAALAMSPKWYSYHVTNWSPWSTHYDAVSRCRHWKSTAIPNIRACRYMCIFLHTLHEKNDHRKSNYLLSTSYL